MEQVILRWALRVLSFFLLESCEGNSEPSHIIPTAVASNDEKNVGKGHNIDDLDFHIGYIKVVLRRVTLLVTTLLREAKPIKFTFQCTRKPFFPLTS